MSYRGYVAEATLADAMEALTQTCGLIGPLDREAQAHIVDAWRRVIGGIAELADIFRANDYTARYGISAGLGPRMRTMVREYQGREAAANGPPDGKGNAPADWNSAEAWADQMTA